MYSRSGPAIPDSCTATAADGGEEGGEAAEGEEAVVEPEVVEEECNCPPQDCTATEEDPDMCDLPDCCVM